MRFIAWAATTIMMLFGAAAEAQTVSFGSSYQNTEKAGSCNSTFQILGREPSTGSHPVFVYLVGTFEYYDNAAALSVVEQMAERGFVAATIEYPNMTFGTCDKLSARSNCVFNGASAQSAISKLCSRTRADCSKGVVVGGFSQGALLSVLSANYDSRIRAVWAMGAGTQYVIYDLAACVADGQRSLSSDRLRVVNGEADDYFRILPGGSRLQSELMTGMSCGSSADSCLSGNGSGWILLQNEQVSDGRADHCYMRDGDCAASEDTLDALWTTGSGDWAVGASLDWLQSLAN